MTTPGSIAAQPTVSSKAGVAALHGTGSKSNADAPNGEAEEGFGEVLSQLQKNGSDEPALAKSGARAGERSNFPRQDTELQLAPEDGADPYAGSLDDLLSGTDLQSVGDPRQQVSETPRTQGLGPDAAATTANDIAALVAVNSALPSVGRGPETPMGAPPARKAANPEAVSETKVAPSATGGEARPPFPVDGTARVEVDTRGGERLATGTDPVLARLGVQGSPIDKDRSERADKNQRPAPATDLPTARVADGMAELAQRLEMPAATQRPRADVLQQETHFAPVSPLSSGPHTGVPASESGKTGDGLEAPSAEMAAAPAVDAPQPNGETPSAATPPAKQIADRIATEAAVVPEFVDHIATGREQPGMKPALKILHIQLQPADLGTVTVRMELKDAELKLHVEAERTETAELIRSDQDTLSKLLRSAGYNLDTASIRVAEGDRTAAAQQPGQPGTQTNQQSSPQSQSGASERQEHAQRGSRSPDGDSGPQASRNDSHETTTNRAGLGLYV